MHHNTNGVYIRASVCAVCTSREPEDYLVTGTAMSCHLLPLLILLTYITFANVELKQTVLLVGFGEYENVAFSFWSPFFWFFSTSLMETIFILPVSLSLAPLYANLFVERLLIRA